MRVSPVTADPHALDEVEHLHVKFVVLVQAPLRIAAEKDRLWCGFYEREEGVARGSVKYIPKMNLVSTLGRRWCRTASGEHDPSIVECAPFCVDHHHTPTPPGYCRAWQ